MDHGHSGEGEGSNSIHLQVSELRRLSEASSTGVTTMFEPHGLSGIEKRDSGNSDENSAFPTSTTSSSIRAPEKKLTLFALRLAVLEKSATGLGTLGFIWATVVLLGGFAITLDKTDFWFITIILLIEGARIFSRSHELEWQHQATWSLTDAGIKSFRTLRSSSNSFFQSLKHIFKPIKKQKHNRREIKEEANGVTPKKWDTPRTPNRTWLLSASACVVLSLIKLVKRNYGEIEKGDSDKRNRESALNIFYALALAEALLFLMEKAYWEWKVSYCKLLEEVNCECELGPSGMVSIRRFFYDAYSRCVNGSVFDGLKMDMVSFAMDLLTSNSPDEQLIGVRILRQFAISERFSDDTLQKIGISISTIERLVEMLNWTDYEEEEIRWSAAEILSKLAGKKQNSLRIAGIPGAMESISSLLHTNRNHIPAADEIGEKKLLFDHPNYAFWTFSHLGLLILKKLARDHDNCGKIGNTKGLLPKIIDFTHVEERVLKNENVTPFQIKTVKRSLQLVKMLASTTGTNGNHLRKEISEIVFTISNIRDILRYGEKQPQLQKLGIEILTSLALEDDATERIGGTGGVLKELFNIFFKQITTENQEHVTIVAGEALAMLVLQAIMSEENKLQEVMVGVAANAFKFMSSQESSIAYEEAGITEAELANKLIQILKKHQYPPTKVPRIRRFVVELAIWMMKDKPENISTFKDLGMEEVLECVLETTSELESFNVFSGTVGLNRHNTTIHTLVETALKLLGDRSNKTMVHKYHYGYYSQ
ncbi:Armadillo-type fold [Senna tora]|uniref:Armadillo-type fold n=1 Tax=Senna tora TaxID=362788 RepID=A0A834X2R4_9FABA|nr:Armadillo-type fold [Senna tora]